MPDDMTLERRLAHLGDRLDVDVDVVDDVLARLGKPADSSLRSWSFRTGRTPRSVARRPLAQLLDDSGGGAAARWTRAAAAVALIVAGLLVVPSSRRAIADWFGLDGVRIERRPELSVPSDAASGEVAGDIGRPPVGFDPSTVDDAIHETEIDASFEALTKTLAPGTGIVEIEVVGHQGLWIDGEPHEVFLRSRDGDVTARRFAGNTLLWQDGDVIHRVEGFETLDEALAYVRESRG